MNSKPPILVCVTGQRDCDRLIHIGKKFSDENHTSLYVVSVVPSNSKNCANELEYLRQTSIKSNADMTVFFNDNPAYMVAAFIKEINACKLITGMAETPVNGFVEIIHQLVPKMPISMVDKHQIVYNIYPDEEINAQRLVFNADSH